MFALMQKWICKNCSLVQCQDRIDWEKRVLYIVSCSNLSRVEKTREFLFINACIFPSTFPRSSRVAIAFVCFFSCPESMRVIIVSSSRWVVSCFEFGIVPSTLGSDHGCGHEGSLISRVVKYFTLLPSSFFFPRRSRTRWSFYWRQSRGTESLTHTFLAFGLFIHIEGGIGAKKETVWVSRFRRWNPN